MNTYLNIVEDILWSKRTYSYKGKTIELPLPQRTGTATQKLSYAKDKAAQVLTKLDIMTCKNEECPFKDICFTYIEESGKLIIPATPKFKDECKYFYPDIRKMTFEDYDGLIKQLEK